MAGSRLSRYALATVGPVGAAAAQFALSIVMLKRLDLEAFGIFSLLLVGCQFSWSLWSALFCAPLPVLLARAAPAERPELRLSLLSTSLAAATVIGAGFAIVTAAAGESAATALVVGLYAGLALVRWFARADAYAAGDQPRVVRSDLVYSLTLVCLVAALALTGPASLVLAFGSLLLATLVALLPFGRAFLVDQFGRFRPARLGRYRQVLRDYSRWSVIGVITTEATANAHVYLVTLISGPAALAALAAPALLTRPINVTINALTDFERPRMARLVGDGDRVGARASTRLFRLTLVATWLATTAAIIGLMREYPRLLFPPQYALGELEIAIALWLGIAGIRVLWTPDSVLLQAMGAFRPLALASVGSAVVSVIAVLALLLTGGPLWSLVGLVIGEVVYGVAVVVLARRESARR